MKIIQMLGRGKKVRTFMAKAQDIERKWYLIDAQDKVLVVWHRKLPQF